MKPAIRVENLAKSYRINHAAAGRQNYRTLREGLSGAMDTLLKWRKSNGAAAGNEVFWALQDVSFEVKPGEVVGIIGRNGAGKSTLLKILSRITKPSGGHVELHGRVGSLLEVGTGFHPELSGRENIYLNGSILGMARREIDRQFDAIVDFSGVEKFLDTPVKRYSSGMYVRLAFAVAAHLEPEILIVDEVLAVGDAQFQKKCLGKMRSASKSDGRTVLFVSHNMSAINELCDSAYLIAGGRIQEHGPTADVIRSHVGSGMDNLGTEQDLTHWPDRSGSGAVKILHAALTWSDYRKQPMAMAMGGDLLIDFTLRRELRIDPAEIRLSVAIRTTGGVRVLHVSEEDDRFELLGRPPRRCACDCPTFGSIPAAIPSRFGRAPKLTRNTTMYKIASASKSSRARAFAGRLRRIGARVLYFRLRIGHLLIRPSVSPRRRVYPRLTEPDYLHLVSLREAMQKASVGCRGLLVDYGCGCKPYRELFDSMDSYIGVDFDVTDPTDRKLGRDGLLPVESGTADVVLSNQVLEHVPDVALHLSECARALRPGGRLILSTHGIWPYHPGPQNDDFYRWTGAGLERETQRSGLRVISTTPACGGLLCVAQQLLVLNDPYHGKRGLTATLGGAIVNFIVNFIAAVLWRIAPRWMNGGDIVPICFVVEAIKPELSGATALPGR